MKLKTIFRVRVVYKSGFAQDFDCYSFKITGGRYEWESVPGEVKPVLLGVEEIAAVWQIGERRKLIPFWRPA